MRLLVSIFYLLLSVSATAQLARIEPPNWWVGMKDHSLQPTLKGTNLNQFDQVRAIPRGLKSLRRINNHPDYLFVDPVESTLMSTSKHFCIK